MRLISQMYVSSDNEIFIKTPVGTQLLMFVLQTPCGLRGEIFMYRNLLSYIIIKSVKRLLLISCIKDGFICV